jgi:hypothetical protein
MSTSPSAAEPLIFPIGHTLGALLAGGDKRIPRIRRGPEVKTPEQPAYATWLLLHGDPDALEKGQAWTRRAVEELAESSGGGSVAGHIDQLLADGLAVEVVPGTPQALQFAETHRLVPLMLGLGNTADEPWLYGIGLIGQPLVTVTHPVFEVWQWSPAEESLWLTCRGTVEVARRAGSTNPDVTDAERLLNGFLPTVHSLLAAGVACLDVHFRLRPPGS